MEHQNSTLALQTGAAQLVSMSIQGGPPYVSLPPPQGMVVPAVPGQMQEVPGQGAVQLPPAVPGPAIPGRKHCGGCGNVKSSDEFHKSKSRGDGLQSHCKECMARLHTNWRKKRPEVMAPAVESKVCGGCNKEKPASEFYADRKRRDGLQCQCKACTSQHHERWRAKKREEVAGQVAADKECRACGERKEAAEFCRDTRSPDGLQSRCKACYQIYFSLWSAQKKAMRDPVAAAKAAPAGQKICATCGVEKPLGEYKVSRSKTTKDGRAGSCLECSKRKSGADKRAAPDVVHPIAAGQDNSAMIAEKVEPVLLQQQPGAEAVSVPAEAPLLPEQQNAAMQQDAQQAPKKRRRKALKTKTAGPYEATGLEEAGAAPVGAVVGFPRPGEFSGAMAEALAE